MSNQTVEVEVKNSSNGWGCCVGWGCLAIMILIVAALACTPFFLF